MTRSGLNLFAERAFFAVLALGLLAMLAANLPGHMSYDSVIALTEGRFQERITWAPAFYSWVLGTFDAVLQGTGLYVASSGLLLFGALASFAGLRGRVSLVGPVVALLIVLTPQLLIYQGIVWKDVFFANVATAGMVCLAHAAAVWGRPLRRWPWLIATLLLLAAGALTRQNGLVVGLAAAVVLGWVGARGDWRRGLAWGGGGLVALMAATHLIGAYAAPAKATAEDGLSEGVRIVQNYDLLGALAREPAMPMAELDKAYPNAAAAMRREAPRWYSPERVDFLDDDPALGQAQLPVPPEAIAAQWRDLILQRPDLYLRQRLEVFRWVFLTPVIDRCLPIAVGVSGPADRLQDLGLTEGWSPTDIQLINYSTWALDTPVYSHLTYAALALAVGLFLLWRREAADLAMAGLMAGALGFTASFFVISLACDYRYLYFLDVAALAGLLYVAVDPRLRPGRSKLH